MLSELIARRFPQLKALAEVTVAQRATSLLSTACGIVEGLRDEGSRGGIRWNIASSAATGIAPVQALPTTAAQWLLYNPASNPKTIWLDDLGEWLVSGTAGAGATLLVGLCSPAQLPATRPTTTSAGIVLTNRNPNSGQASKLVVVSGQTLAASPGWAPFAFMNPAGTVLGQTQMERLGLDGSIALAPDTGLALVVISPTGTSPLFAPYGSYREYASDME